MRVFFILLMFVFCSGQALAAAKTLEVTWSYPETANAESFTLWERTSGGKVEAVSAPGDARSAQWELADPGTDCRTYFLTAVQGGVESLPSNAVAWCPEAQLPDMKVRPGQAINLRIEVVE